MLKSVKNTFAIGSIVLFFLGFLPGIIWWVLVMTAKGNISLCKCPNCEDIIISKDDSNMRKNNVKGVGASISTFDKKAQKRIRKELANFKN